MSLFSPFLSRLSSHRSFLSLSLSPSFYSTMSSSPNPYIGKPRSSLPTPCLIVREQKLKAALLKMKETLNGKALRPHVKSHKCVRLGKRQIEEGGAVGLAAAKVSEAEPFVVAGLTDILITSPTSHPEKIESLVDLWVQSNGDLSTVVDSEEGVELLAQALRKRKGIVKKGEEEVKMKVLLDIDGGQERTGVASLEEAERVAEKIVSTEEQGGSGDVMNLIGAQTYLGHLQHIHGWEERKKASEEGLERGGKIVRGLREGKKYGGLEVHTGVGTGTHEMDVENDIVTEIQPGSYCLMDAEYALIEWKDNFWRNNIPMTLLTSIVSNKHFPRHVTVDGGWKATYLFPAAPNLVYGKGGSGVGGEEERKEGGVEMVFSYQGDEHGRVEFKGGEVERGGWGLGEVVEVVVSHVDPTVNLHDRMYVVDEESDKCVDVYEIDARGCMA